jgi:hypothetical protein
VKLAPAAALLAAGIVAIACSSANTECDCADPAITLSIPSDVAPSVTAVHLTGPACEGVDPTCTNQAGGCSQYRFDAKAAGICNVEIDFATGRTFQAQLTLAGSSESCCAGFYPSPASAGQIAVPSPDGGN